MFRSFLSALAAALVLCVYADDGMGHSKHGSAFDSGMRTKPWVISGIGEAPFPITTKNPEAQQWFNQGNVLLHSFWFEEAERSFRWSLKLDPGNAMAYWGMAKCGFTWFSMGAPNFDDKTFDRYKVFLKEAVKRKNTVTERERMYIEAYEMAVAAPNKTAVKVLNRKLQDIVLKYPDDLEAKASLALFNIGEGSAFANELIIREVLAKNPMHPGAHHASIHNWDGLSSEQAIDSCEKYGRSAPNVGHALHMPGHIYTKIGMWHEAAIAMDSATRIELSYMNDRLALPFETWNYPHNRNYLCYIHEQLGMAQAALGGARDMLAAPNDPEYNPGANGPVGAQGFAALSRCLMKFEMWDKIMQPGYVNWDESNDFSKLNRAFCETLALSGLGRPSEAKERFSEFKTLHTKLTADIKDPEDITVQMLKLFSNVLEGTIALAENNVLVGHRALLNAADMEANLRTKGAFSNDPPDQPWPVLRLLGDDYRKRGQHSSAIDCYTKSLEQEPNDGFSLSGLALSYAAMGNTERATHFAGRLEYVWSNADKGLKWLEEVRALKLNAQPIGITPRPERTYVPKTLDKLGPMNWQPFAAPALTVLNVNGKPVSLADYRGKNVILVFFLGEACVHCVGQLKSINDRISEFEAQDTVVLGVCSASPQKLKDSVELNKVKIKFLSDNAHENARRFSSYDDFEDIELHSTILIDKKGMIRWKRTGGDPFMNMDFLVNELKRINSAK